MKESFKSQFDQDKIILSLIAEDTPKFFVELGAHDGIDLSNSYYFEKELGWTGILIEPNPDTYKSLVQNRSSFTSDKLCGEVEGEEVDFVLAGVVSGVITETPSYWVKANLSNPSIRLKTHLLGNILRELNAPKKMGFLSLDVEGFEYPILKTFPFEEFDFDVICVEHNACFDGPENQDSIFSLLTEKGYKLELRTNVDDFYIKERHDGDI